MQIKCIKESILRLMHTETRVCILYLRLRSSLRIYGGKVDTCRYFVLKFESWLWFLYRVMNLRVGDERNQTDSHWFFHDNDNYLLLTPSIHHNFIYLLFLFSLFACLSIKLAGDVSKIFATLDVGWVSSSLIWWFLSTKISEAFLYFFCCP